MSWLKRSEISWVVIVICTLIMLADYFVPFAPLAQAAAGIQRWVTIMTFFALVLGLVALGSIHVRYLVNRTKGQWYYSAWLLFVGLFMITFGLLAPGIGRHPWFLWVYAQGYQNISGTFSGIASVYLTAAMYRAFRVRTPESAVMLVAAGILMLFYMPFGNILWPGVTDIGIWLFTVPNAAVQRALIITAFIGMAAMMFRVLVGREKGVTSYE